MELVKCYNIVSVNAGALRTKERFDTALQFCKNSGADFSVLQETHLGPAKYNDIKSQWDGEIYISPGTTFRDGILLLANSSAPKLDILKTDKTGKFIIFRITNTSDVVVALYAPSGILKDRQELRQNFFRKLRKLRGLHTTREDNIILLGDFNNTLKAIDRSTNDPREKEAKSELENLIQQFDLEDHWRLQNPNEKLYTHYHGRTHTCARLDRAYTNIKLRTSIKIRHILNSFSDHFHAVLVQRKNAGLIRGKGYWILNNSLLQDKEYKKAIVQLWNNWRSQKQCFDSISEWWEKGKKHVKDFTKLYTRATTEKQTKRKASLEKRLRNIYRKIDRKPELQTMANSIRSQLFQIELKEAQGAKVRSRLRCELEGEICTKFFFAQMEKRKNAKQDMLSIKRIKDGKILTEQAEILNEVKNFYANLYAENSKQDFCGRNRSSYTNGAQKKRKQEEMLRKLSKTVSRENRELCEKALNTEEIKKAILTFENNKSPGNDGLTAEFYNTFLDILLKDLQELYGEISEKGRMPDTMRQAVITCIYKKGEIEDITNWRPISLLNYDYKILTKTLANRIQSSLNDIIGTEQTAAIRGRTIIENLQLNRDIISYANFNNLEASIITLDQEKAFDRVDRQFLFKTLRKFGYGPKLISIIEVIYNNIEAQVKVNGNMSSSFLIERGVRQGCPLSMILYIILAEVMIQNIRQNRNIQGIKVSETEIKISAFADDTTLYIGENDSLIHLQSQLQDFELFAGVKYNREKCVGMWLGINIDNTEKPLGFKWNSEKIRILGYIYGQNPKDNQDQNWQKIKTKIQKDISKWNNLRLSLIGRKLIINQVMLSKICYLAYVETPPKPIIQDIKKDIYNFLWNFKKVRVNMATTTMPIDIGGLAVIDIETQCKAIKCAVIAKFLQDIQQKKVWTEAMLWHLNKFRDAKQGINVFKTYIPNTNRSKLEQFYRDLLIAWTDLTDNEKVEPITLAEIYNEPLFFNKKSVRQNNQSEYLLKKPPPWAREHFRTVGDICKKTQPGFIPMEEFLSANKQKVVRYSPKPKDLHELIKLLPEEWKQKIENGNTETEASRVIIKHRTLNGKWRLAEVSALQCKDFYNTIHFRKLMPMYKNRKYLQWQANDSNTLSEKQWNTLFMNLYKKTKQRDSFDVRYRFLHFAQPTAIRLKEIREGYTDTVCPRCGEQEETHKHWMFSCASSQNLYIYLQSIFENVYTGISFPNTETECLLQPLLKYADKFPIAAELYEIYFICIRNLRRDATYRTLLPRKMQITTFQDAIKDRLTFLYNVAILEDNLEPFLRTWNKLITREGKIRLPQISRLK